MSEPKSIIFCLKSPSLKAIVEKANRIAILKKLLNEILPKELSSRCHVTNISNGTLLLQLDSAAFSVRVRYLIPTLLEQLNQKKMRVTTIRCCTRPLVFY